MSLNNTPTSERIHIGVFGKRNSGKSSLVNAITGQKLSIVSEIKGTTTDPVLKTMELLPLGPVVIIDTAGIDDEGDLGNERVKKSYQILNKTDIAVVVIDGLKIDNENQLLIEKINSKEIPYIIVHNKCDTFDCNDIQLKENEICVSSLTGENINELKDLFSKVYKNTENERRIISDIIKPSDFVILVVPIDKAAPKGRLILPQQQTIRDILDTNANAIVIKETELKNTLDSLNKKPSIVVCDSQIFEKVSNELPEDIRLTSFSILMARYKGNLEQSVEGVNALNTLNNGDKILISEGCSHHRQCGDIGTVKLPKWIKEYTNKDFVYEFTSGIEFPEDLTPYKLVIHCGGCMLNEKEMKYRYRQASEQNIPITNYGILIADINGILKRSLKPFKR